MSSMEHQEANELLLSRTWQTGGDMAVGEDAEPAKEFDAQDWSNNHPPRLHGLRQVVAKGGRSSKPPPLRTRAPATVAHSDAYELANDFSGCHMGTFAST